MSREMFEILAPAGGPEALRAAVYAGADAVYLGGPAFGARANAQNFTREQLAEAVGFCRARGVRVHVTVNTLVKDRSCRQPWSWWNFSAPCRWTRCWFRIWGCFPCCGSGRPSCPCTPLPR